MTLRRTFIIWFGAASCVGALTFSLTIHEFLAVSCPVEANILVVEGWVWNSPAIKEASDEFNRGRYRWLVTVGSPIENGWAHPGQKRSASLAAERLRDLGVSQNRIVVLHVPSIRLHRTYASSIAVRDWLRGTEGDVAGVNVFTIGAHARKSLILYKRALGPGVNVGVIAGTEDAYEDGRWWTSARGVYVVLRKTLGYMYALYWPVSEDLLYAQGDMNYSPPSSRNH